MSQAAPVIKATARVRENGLVTVWIEGELLQGAKNTSKSLAVELLRQYAAGAGDILLATELPGDSYRLDTVTADGIQAFASEAAPNPPAPRSPQDNFSLSTKESPEPIVLSPIVAAPSVAARKRLPDFAGLLRRLKPAMKLRKFGLPLGVWIATTLTLVTVGAFIASGLVPTPASQPENTLPAAPSKPLSWSSLDALAVRGFALSPTWTATVPEGGTMAAFDAGVVTVSGTTLRFLSPNNGKEISSTDAGAPIDFIAETTVSGERAIVWRAGANLQAKIGDATEVVTAALSTEILSTTGDGVLAIKDGTASILTKSGLTTVPVPATFRPVATDSGNLVSANFDGQILVTNPAGERLFSSTLQPPSPKMTIESWVQVGGGLAVVIWSDQSAKVLSIHRIEDGTAVESLDVSDVNLANTTWIKGQGGQLAALGPLLFNAKTGELVAGSPGEAPIFKAARGGIAIGSGPEGQFFSNGQEAYYSNTALIAVISTSPTDKIAIVRDGQRVLGLTSE